METCPLHILLARLHNTNDMLMVCSRIINAFVCVFVAGGDSYVNPWSKECAKNTTKKLKQFGSQLEGLHQGEGERG